MADSGRYSLSALSKPFFYFTTTWGGVLVVRFMDRVGKGIRTAPRDALLADSVDAKNYRGIAFGLHRAGDTLGAMFGLIIALALVSAAQSETVSLSRETFQNVVLISIIPGISGGSGFLALGAREVPVEGVRKVLNLSLGGMPRQFRLFLWIVVIFTLGNSSDAFLDLRAQERGLSVTGVLGMLITFNLVYALISGPAGALSDRIGRWQLILGGWAVYGLIYLGFALATEAWHVWALYALYGVYYGVFEGTSKALVADVVPAQQRGTAYGIYNTAVGLVALPASLLAGIYGRELAGGQDLAHLPPSSPGQSCHLRRWCCWRGGSRKRSRHIPQDK